MPIKIVERHSDVYIDDPRSLPGKFERGRSRTLESMTSQLYDQAWHRDPLQVSAGVTAIELTTTVTTPMTSRLYPQHYVESMRVDAKTNQAILRDSPKSLDPLRISAGVVSIDLRNLVLTHQQPNDERLRISAATVSITLTTVVQNHSQPNDDRLRISAATTSISLLLNVVNQNQPGEDRLRASAGVTSISLS